MALTLKVELKLKDVGLIALFNKDKAQWLGMAKKSYAFVKENFPNGAVIRTDDVSEALLPLLEVHDDLRKFLAEKKKRDLYWYRWFCDLILDRTWNELEGGGDGN